VRSPLYTSFLVFDLLKNVKIVVVSKSEDLDSSKPVPKSEELDSSKPVPKFEELDSSKPVPKFEELDSSRLVLFGLNLMALRLNHSVSVGVFLALWT
jgi:hypothetical protein